MRSGPRGGRASAAAGRAGGTTVIDRRDGGGSHQPSARPVVAPDAPGSWYAKNSAAAAAVDLLGASGTASAASGPGGSENGSAHTLRLSCGCSAKLCEKL